MAGYSGTPLAQKLGIKAGARLLLADAPAAFADWVAPLPEGVTLVGPRAKGVDVAVLFERRAAALRARFARAARALAPNGGLWVAWPKRSAKVPTDLTEGVVREIGLAAGLVDNKVCAISEVWSGLRFVYRLKDR